MGQKTAKIGQSCVQLYKTKTPHAVKRHWMYEISRQIAICTVF